MISKPIIGKYNRNKLHDYIKLNKKINSTSLEASNMSNLFKFTKILQHV